MTVIFEKTGNALLIWANGETSEVPATLVVQEFSGVRAGGGRLKADQVLQERLFAESRKVRLRFAEWETTIAMVTGDSVGEIHFVTSGKITS